MAISFDFKCVNEDLKIEYNALKYYSENKPDQKDWIGEDKGPIFLDANVLLGMYRMSFNERTEFINFIFSRRNNIILCNQVTKEFLKHRLEYAQNVPKALRDLENESEQLLNDILKYIDCLKGRIKEVQSRHYIRFDQPEINSIYQSLLDEIDILKTEDNQIVKQIENVCRTATEKIKETSEKYLKDLDYRYNDPVLDAIQAATHLDGFSDEEINQIKNQYTQLCDAYEKVISDFKKKDRFTFPGSGDRDKECDPHGDLIIFYEMLDFIKTKKQDAIFITNDIKKSDWIMKDGNPFVHYIVNIYKMTGQMLYIFAGEEFFPVNTLPQNDDSDVSEENFEQLEGCVKQYEDVPASNYDGTIQDIPESVKIKINDIPIELSNSDGLDEDIPEFNQYSKKAPSFREISEDRFLSELKTALLWSKNYGANYVSADYFVFSILGGKGFRYSKSFEVMESLINNGKILKKPQQEDPKIEVLEILKD